MSSDFDEDIHPHCFGCVRFTKCTVKPEANVSCEILPCELGCGMKFHRCKRKEHLLLCPNEKVPCYNAVSGCPCVMQRKSLPKHLVSCPASVIHCTMAWNRCYIDRKSERVLKWCAEAAGEGQPQLDIALALRDQQILHRWYMCGKNTFQNSFTNKPLPLRVDHSMTSMLEESYPPKVSYENESPYVAPAGLQSSVCNQLNHSGENYKKDSSVPHTNGHVCDSSSFLHDLEIFHGAAYENKENLVNYLNNIKCLCSQSECVCPWVKSLDSEDRESIPAYDKRLREGIDIERIWQLNSKEASIFNETIVNSLLWYPTRYLGLGPRLESFLCHPKNCVNTYFCAEGFRRDEYAWHYKNVHNDIYGGLNGWLQERCPLAQYGCTFSRQRFHPSPKGSKIVYNQILESFGISQHVEMPASNESNGHLETSQEVFITHLPFEVLQYIARFLDSFSLFNLALTSTLMRDVCQSLLEDRGIVTLRWERICKNNSFSWQVTQKCWSYSPYFTPVKEWLFGDDSAMANHLKSCKYFKRNKKTDPYYHPNDRAPYNQLIYERLKKMSDCCGSENVTTKL